MAVVQEVTPKVVLQEKTMGLVSSVKAEPKDEFCLDLDEETHRENYVSLSDNVSSSFKNVLETERKKNDKLSHSQLKKKSPYAKKRKKVSNRKATYTAEECSEAVIIISSDSDSDAPSFVSEAAKVPSSEKNNETDYRLHVLSAVSSIPSNSCGTKRIKISSSKKTKMKCRSDSSLKSTVLSASPPPNRSCLESTEWFSARKSDPKSALKKFSSFIRRKSDKKGKNGGRTQDTAGMNECSKVLGLTEGDISGIQNRMIVFL